MNEPTASMADRFDRLPDPIFIGGYMRSGTSFIMKLLLGHQRTTGFKADADVLGPILGAWMPEHGAHPYSGIAAVMNQDAERIRKLVRANWFFVYEHAGRPVFAKRIVEKTPDSQAVFVRAAEVFPQALFVVVIREPVSSVRSALAHALLFHPAESRKIGATIKRIVNDWTRSLEETRAAAHRLGDRVLLLNYDEFLADVPGQTLALFTWCGIDADDAAVARAVKIAGGADEERAFWMRILNWPEDEFARRYGAQLTAAQQAWVAGHTMKLFREVDGMRVQVLRSENRPGLSGSAAAV